MSDNLSLYLIRTYKGYIATGCVLTSDIKDALVYDTLKQAVNEMMRFSEYRSQFCGQIMKMTLHQSNSSSTAAMPVESKTLVMVYWTRDAMGSPVETLESVPT
jgi:hypothetical protein